MDYYIEIKINPDAEMRENELLNKVYSKFHKALFELKSQNIGVSFPDYHIKFGQRIRIHGEQKILEAFQKNNWLGGLIGYCEILEIQAIPDQVDYRILSRTRSKMTASRLKRLIERKSIKQDEIRAYKAKMFSESLTEPYLELQSTSTKQLYRRYIHFSEIIKEAKKGKFDEFGLSKIATIPWF